MAKAQVTTPSGMVIEGRVEADRTQLCEEMRAAAGQPGASDWLLCADTTCALNPASRRRRKYAERTISDHKQSEQLYVDDTMS